jgi:hypothetical protein
MTRRPNRIAGRAEFPRNSWNINMSPSRPPPDQSIVWPDDAYEAPTPTPSAPKPLPWWMLIPRISPDFVPALAQGAEKDESNAG